MKKIVVCLSLLCIFIILGCTKKYQLSRFENNKIGFKIKYPAGWIISDQYADVTAALFVAPREKDNDIFSESISVTFQKNDKEFKIHKFEAQIKKYVEAYTRIALIKITVNNKEQERLIFTGAVNNKFQSTDQVYLVTSKGLFIITYTSTPDTYEKYKGVFEACVKTFKET